MMLMFVLTGILVMFGVDEDSTADIQRTTINEKIPLDKLESTLLEYIKSNNIAMPDTSQVHCIKDGVSFGGIRYCVGLVPYENSYDILVLHRDIIGSAIMLHSAKGKIYFTILSTIFGLNVLVIYFSGLYITTFCVKKRGSALLAVGIGLAMLLIFGVMSV